MTKEGPALAGWHRMPLRPTQAALLQGSWVTRRHRGAPASPLGQTTACMNCCASWQLLAFQAEQGHTSLVSKVLHGDYTGVVIHQAVQDVPNYTRFFSDLIS